MVMCAFMWVMNGSTIQYRKGFNGSTIPVYLSLFQNEKFLENEVYCTERNAKRCLFYFLICINQKVDN